MCVCVCVCHWLFCVHTHLHPVTFLFYGSLTRSHTLYVIGLDGIHFCLHCRPPLLSFWRPWSFAHCSWLLMFTSQLCTYDTWCSLVINSIPFHATYTCSPVSKKKYISWLLDLAYSFDPLGRVLYMSMYPEQPNTQRWLTLSFFPYQAFNGSCH